MIVTKSVRANHASDLKFTAFESNGDRLLLNEQTSVVVGAHKDIRKPIEMKITEDVPNLTEMNVPKDLARPPELNPSEGKEAQ